MHCPHCHRQIEEQDRYLMSSDPDQPMPGWAPNAIFLLFCLAVLGLIAIIIH